MEKITIAIYRFFKSRKIVFYTILLLTTAFFAWFSLKINFEEDISKLLPSAEDGGAEELVFSNLKVKDKIFILFNPLSDEVGPDELAETCDAFVQALFDKDTTYNAIHNVLYQVDEDLMLNGIAFLYENVPAYLETDDYARLDSMIQKAQVEKQMEENYSILRSSAGMMYKDLITQDPIALRNLFLSKAGAMASGLGGSYTMYNNHIFTADTTVAIAFLSPNFKAFDSKQGIRLSDMIEEEIDHFQQQNPDIEILYHGAPVQSVYNSRQIKKDLLLTISISLVIIAIILLICFKNKSSILYLVLPVVYGVIFALSIIYFMKGSMSLMAMGIGAIIMGVAFSYCLHVITHYKYLNDPEKVLKDQTRPVILGSLTTIGAFMGLLFTKSELLQDFGLFASLGLTGTTLFCLIFLPQFFRPENNRKSDKAFALLEKINTYPYHKQKWLIALIVIVSMVCFFVSDKVQFDSDLRNIGHNDPRVMKSKNLLEAKTTGNYSTIYFASVSQDLDSALYNNTRLCDKLDKVKARGLIQGYSAPAALFIPTDEQQRRIDQWNDYWTDAKKQHVRKDVTEAGANYTFTPATFTPFFDMTDADYEPVSLFESGVLPGEILENIIEYTDNRYLVFVPVRMDRRQLMEVGNEIVAGDPELVVIDPMYYTNDMVKMMHADFNTTLAVSSLFVLVVLLLSYRNVLLALIAFLPMGLSWYIVLGSMVLMNMQFNLINIVISTFIFGVGVDYSIFIMDGLLATHRTKEATLTYHKTAIFLSAVVLVIVTSSLLFAVHPAIASIGVATLIGMAATLLIAYTLLPFLFSLLPRFRKQKTEKSSTEQNFKR